MTPVPSMSRNTGNFGKLADQYKVGRKGVPEEVLDYLWSHIKKPKPTILDVGCGTGLPSRQLARRGAEVIGTDIAPEMIRAAKENNQENISYLVASTEALPFPDESFDAVTSFSAFHWFTDTGSTKEMKRVLKPGGSIFIVNKNDIGDFSQGYRSIFRQYMTEDLPRIKNGYHPDQILHQAGFENIERAVFPVSEFFTIEQVMEYFQSVSGWNLVPPESKKEALGLLKEYAQSRMSEDLIERKIEIVVQTGVKPL